MSELLVVFDLTCVYLGELISKITNRTSIHCRRDNPELTRKKSNKKFTHITRRQHVSSDPPLTSSSSLACVCLCVCGPHEDNTTIDTHRGQKLSLQHRLQVAALFLCALNGLKQSLEVTGAKTLHAQQ